MPCSFIWPSDHVLGSAPSMRSSNSVLGSGPYAVRVLWPTLLHGCSLLPLLRVLASAWLPCPAFRPGLKLSGARAVSWPYTRIRSSDRVPGPGSQLSFLPHAPGPGRRIRSSRPHTSSDQLLWAGPQALGAAFGSSTVPEDSRNPNFCVGCFEFITSKISATASKMGNNILFLQFCLAEPVFA